MTITIIQPGEYHIYVDPHHESRKIPRVLIRGSQRHITPIWLDGIDYSQLEFKRWTTPLTCIKRMIGTNMQYGKWRFRHIPEIVYPT